MRGSSSTAAGISLKLLIDRKRMSVVFGEAGKELVDFLFSLLSLPLATIVGLLGTHAVPGSVGELFASIEKLDNTFILTSTSSFPEQKKEELLNPRLPSKIHKLGLQLPWKSPPQEVYVCENCWPSGRVPYVATTCEEGCPYCGSGRMRKQVFLVGADSRSHGSSCKYYRCGRFSCTCVTTISGTTCPSCSGPMSSQLQSRNSSSKQSVTDQPRDEGFVKGVVTYTITDDLSVAPQSTISSITLIQKLLPHRQDLASLEERTVTVGMREGLEILKASLHSKKVLTEVFLAKKKVCPENEVRPEKEQPEENEVCPENDDWIPEEVSFCHKRWPN